MSSEAYVGDLVKWTHRFEELMVSFIEGRRVIVPGGRYLTFSHPKNPVCLDYAKFADLDSGDCESVYQLYGEALDLVEDGKNLKSDFSGSKDRVKNFYGGLFVLSRIFLPVAYYDNVNGSYSEQIENKPLLQRAMKLAPDAVGLTRKAGLNISNKNPVSGVYVRMAAEIKKDISGPDVPVDFNDKDVERLVKMILREKDSDG